MVKVSFVDDVRGKILPAVPVPFDRAGAIDSELQSQYVEWMATQHIGGIATWAHTGRGLHLSVEERECVLQAWRVGCPKLPIVCGVGVPRDRVLPTSAVERTKTVLEQAVSMGSQAKTGGADGVLVYPPSWLAHMPDAEARMLEYHQAIAELGLPVIVFYLYEAAGGVSYSRSLVEALLDIDNVVAIKVATLDSVMTFQDLAGQLASRSALLMTGEDRFLGYTFQMGAESALVGIAAAATDKCVSLLNAWRSDDFARFATESRMMDRFSMATFHDPMEGYIQRMLWAAEADGVFPREAFDRHGPPLDSADRLGVHAALRKMRAR